MSDQIDYIAAVAKYGSMNKAAEAMGIPRTTFQNRWNKAKQAERLTEVGYVAAPTPEMTPEEAWRSHQSTFERTLAKSKKVDEFKIERTGPFAIFHCTDEHIDDDSTPLNLLEADIQASHQINAIMCHGGDLLNNWPLAGRLAKQWSEQSCTMSAALLRAQHFISIFKPNIWIDGNHEDFNPYLVNLFDEWLKPHKPFRDYWRINFTVEVSGGRECRVAMSHKFQKGSSWFHKSHGHIREMLEGEETDLYMDGHIHSDGVMDHTIPEREHSALLISSAGYKVLDKYATRISRGGKTPKLRGRAHWIVCDPFADYDENFLTAFKSAEQAEVFLNGLQNLRAV